MTKINFIRNAAMASILGAVSVLLVSESVMAEASQLRRAKETDESRIQLMVSWLEKTINDPSHVNIHILAKMVVGGSTAELTDRITEMLGTGTQSDDICHTGIDPRRTRRFGDGYVVEAVVVSNTPAGITEDSIELVFEGSVASAAKPLRFKRLDESVSRISGLLASTSSYVSRVRQSSALSECDPLNIGYAISPNLFHQISYDPAGNYLTLSRTSQGKWGGSLFDQPFDVVPLDYRERSSIDGSIVHNYRFLAGSDMNWDRLIVTQS